MKDIFAGIILIALGYTFLYFVGLLGKMVWGL
jgi:hypothetical protein